MSKMLGIVAALVLAASAHAQTTDPYQLVGFTTSTSTGDAGVLNLTLSCQTDFGPPARMCTSVEILETVVVPTGLTGDAWVRPVYQPHQWDPPGPGVINTLDASGTHPSGFGGDADNLSCISTPPGVVGRGLTVSAQGQFVTSFACTTPLPVACCAPIPLPEPSTLILNGASAAAIGAMAMSKRAR